MKRAKLVLAAIAVIAIAGGVYASKAKQSETLFIKASPEATECLLPAPGYTLSTTFTNVPATAATNVTTIPGACPLVTVYFSGL